MLYSSDMEREIRKGSEISKIGEMRKRRAELADGRYLIFFSFDDREETNDIKEESAEKRLSIKGD